MKSEPLTSKNPSLTPREISDGEKWATSMLTPHVLTFRLGWCMDPYRYPKQKLLWKGSASIQWGSPRSREGGSPTSWLKNQPGCHHFLRGFQGGLRFSSHEFSGLACSIISQEECFAEGSEEEWWRSSYKELPSALASIGPHVDTQRRVCRCGVMRRGGHYLSKTGAG